MLKTKHILVSTALAGASVLFASPVTAQSTVTDIGTIDAETVVPGKAPGYSPYAGRNFPSRVFWGDTHLHTSASLDAGAFGTRLGFEDAYRFARGEELTASGGERVKLSRPLDFLVISDHSDNMGFFPALFAGDPKMLADKTGRRWYDLVQKGGQDGVKAALEIIDSFSRGQFPKALEFLPGSDGFRSTWDQIIAAAEKYNEPGRFSAFIGYEWTSQVPPGNNLHRVVIYRDGGAQAKQTLPFTTYPPQGSTTPEDLWKHLQAYEDKTGGRVLAIAHNGNLSNGWMFPIETNPSNGQPLSAEYAETRARWEPLYEVTQIKGDGEAHPYLSPNDEFAGYELWDKGNLNLSEVKKPEMLVSEYARAALQTGLLLEGRLGTNPYKFGMIGATDSHTSLATAEEDNFFGKHTGAEPKADRASHEFMRNGDVFLMGWQMVSSGYAGVWASDNTREAIWDAMRRKEVYATTGPRMLVRFFGGWEFTDADAQSRTPAFAGYAKGVPMGGDLSDAPDGKAPTFLLAALKDPLGGNLDRIQVVKGWIDAAGARQEKVYDVASSDGRVAGADGKLPAVGNTVDVATATWANTIGASELVKTWTDPDFDPALRAFYYARVLEIPTPRWTAYDAVRFSVKMPDGVPMFGQERAYTSPIWYTPRG
ncbi:DUF3604 domain-containing protein [Phyllobacterium endophyticum]|uniref:DUF3604 domain-containing protein n=1 Tax=Phyllobacterium endophyticum TaxID=1149773 RepID=A0A2P7ARF3_9HYPH|nr:DUF3604 domain-containing protein [Phyllobacterium endophyticum]MBB3237412.1 hypothetical protein [Phyllobacterium endophyticum]PSH56747.1 hypothetical protein CU100_15500 [Phyllobacterium endophyticum]TYR44270.1 DUF3604 domain-containing protein [Phyllobacterium endophyticum]